MFLKIVLRQCRYKWGVTFLLWLAMTALVTLYVYLDNSARFSNRSMQIIVKNMGHNLLILPKDARALDSYLCTESQRSFPEAAAEAMARNGRLPSKYYSVLLQVRQPVAGGEVILTGIRPVLRGDETAEKAHLTAAVAPGHARLGARAAPLLGAVSGDTIELRSRRFQVEGVLPELGLLDDYRVYIPLDECQKLLDRPSEVNALLAFLCLSGGSTEQTMTMLRGMLARTFPDFQAISQLRLAQGRSLARQTTQRYLYYLLAIVLTITVVVIAATGLQEVAERKHEAGILLSMGAGYGYVVGLYLIKLLLLGVLAACGGFLLGSLLSKELLTPVLAANTQPVSILWGQLPRVIALAALVVMAAAALPVWKLARLDPCRILTEE